MKVSSGSIFKVDMAINCCPPIFSGNANALQNKIEVWVLQNAQRASLIFTRILTEVQDVESGRVWKAR